MPGSRLLLLTAPSSRRWAVLHGIGGSTTRLAGLAHERLSRRGANWNLPHDAIRADIDRVGSCIDIELCCPSGGGEYGVRADMEGAAVVHRPGRWSGRARSDIGPLVPTRRPDRYLVKQNVRGRRGHGHGHAVAAALERCPKLVARRQRAVQSTQPDGGRPLSDARLLTLHDPGGDHRGIGRVSRGPRQAPDTIAERAVRLQGPGADCETLGVPRLDRSGPRGRVRAEGEGRRIEVGVVDVTTAIPRPDDRLDLMVADTCGEAAISRTGGNV